MKHSYSIQLFIEAAIAWPEFEIAISSDGRLKLTKVDVLLFKMSTINRQNLKIMILKFLFNILPQLKHK